MIREVVGAIAAVFVGVILLWFIIPMLETSKDVVVATVDTSDPTVQTLISLGDGMFLMLGFVTILVVGFIVLASATRNVPFDFR